MNYQEKRTYVIDIANLKRKNNEGNFYSTMSFNKMLKNIL